MEGQMDSKQFAKSHKDCICKRWSKQRIDSSGNGYVLIFVLWAIAILSMVAMGFSKDTKLSIILETIGTERIKGLYAARGASLYAIAKMSIDDNGNNANPQNMEEDGFVAPGGLPVEGDAPKVVKSEEKSEEKSEDIISGDNAKLDNTKWVPGENPYSVDIGDIVCDVYISSENGKLNINAIDRKKQRNF